MPSMRPCCRHKVETFQIDFGSTERRTKVLARSGAQMAVKLLFYNVSGVNRTSVSPQLFRRPTRHVPTVDTIGPSHTN
jgi:hypothetical protein